MNTNPVASPLREVPLIEAGTEELASFFAPVQTIVHPPVQVQPLDPYASIPDPLGGLGDPLQVTLQDETAMPPVEEDHHTQRFDASKVIESLGQTDEWPVLVDRVNAVLAKVGKATTDGDIRGLLTASEREPRSAVKLLELVDISDPEYAGASGVAVLRKVWEA